MNKFLLSLLLLLASVGASEGNENGVDLIVFSKDRPLQLYAFLESTERYLTGISHINVIYCSSDGDYEEGYRIVKEAFPKVNYRKQSSKPYADFKPLLLDSVYSNNSSAPYVVFGVDDIIVKDYANLEECAAVLKKYKAWGFFLRLGKNINYTYTSDKKSPVPLGKNVEGNFFVWKFANGKGDWGYPNNVDMTIYRKKGIKKFLTETAYTYPNTLEGEWANQSAPDMVKKGVCYHFSKTVNLPLNILTVNSRHMHTYTIHDLLVKFFEGYKINIQDFYKINNKSQHIEHDITFIPRN